MSDRNEYRVPQAKAYRLWAEAYRLEAEAKTLFGFASEESISHSLDLAVAYDSMAEDMEASIATDAAEKIIDEERNGKGINVADYPMSRVKREGAA